MLANSDVLIGHRRGNAATRDELVHAPPSPGPLATSAVSLTEVAGRCAHRSAAKSSACPAACNGSKSASRWHGGRDAAARTPPIPYRDWPRRLPYCRHRAHRGTRPRHLEYPPLPHVSQAFPALPDLKAASPKLGRRMGQLRAPGSRLEIIADHGDERLTFTKPGAKQPDRNSGYMNFPDPGRFRFPCSSPPSDTHSGGTSPFSEHRLNTRTPRLMPAASPRR
jgi:hypothetical protein